MADNPSPAYVFFATAVACAFCIFVARMAQLTVEDVFTLDF
jgi:hypothetical protein